MGFKIGNKVKDGNKEGVVIAINPSSSQPYKVDFGDHSLTYQGGELELIHEVKPEYKNLSQLWEENGRRPFKAIHKDGDVIIYVVGIDGNTAVHWDADIGNYSKGWGSLIKHWQLYQEPEEKPAEKCKHKNAVKQKRLRVDILACKDCGVELEEKWLWYAKQEDKKYPERLLPMPMTEEQASKNWRIFKKATSSRELFEVEND